MFLGKKGQVGMSLEETIKTVLTLIVVLGPLTYLFILLLTPVFSSPEKRDFEKIYEELIALEKGEDIPVFLKGKNYNIVLYGNENIESGCNKKSCLCMIKEGGGTECKILPKEFADCGAYAKVCIEKGETVNSGFVEKENSQLMIARTEERDIKMQLVTS